MCVLTDLDVASLGQHVLLLGLAQLHRHLIAAATQLLWKMEGLYFEIPAKKSSFHEAKLTSLSFPLFLKALARLSAEASRS